MSENREIYDITVIVVVLQGFLLLFMQGCVVFQ
jgi:hypothetical protein